MTKIKKGLWQRNGALIQTLVLDTSAYSALDKGNAAISAHLAAASNLLIPVIVIAELLYGFKNGSRQTENIERLERFTAQEHVELAFIDTYKLADQYALLQLHSRQHAKVLSNNDLWIMAITEQMDASLVTLDQDFAVFGPLMGERLLICAA